MKELNALILEGDPALLDQADTVLDEWGWTTYRVNRGTLAVSVSSSESYINVRKRFMMERIPIDELQLKWAPWNWDEWGPDNKRFRK